MLALLVATGGSAHPGSVSATTGSPGADACADGSGARVRAGGTAQEPKLYPDNEANAYGVIKDRPRLANGSTKITTIFHVISDHVLQPGEQARYQTLISRQMTVLNDAYAGRTSAAASDTPFRFELSKTTYTVNPGWAQVTPAKAERAMKTAQHEGDSTTLNVYAADIGGGLLGWAYFPKGYTTVATTSTAWSSSTSRCRAGRRASTPRATPSPTRSVTG